MTVIAYRDGVLAGDRLADYGGTPLKTRKVHKVRIGGAFVLLGHSGNWNFCGAWVEWLRGKRDKPVLPSGESFTGLIVHADGKLFQVEASLEPIRIYPKFHAIGSGRGEAIGAMEMGADAKRAVLVSAKFNIHVGLGVDVVRF